MLKIIRHRFLGLFKKMKFIPQPIYVGILYEYYTGKKFKRHNSTEFNEKIQWYKAYYKPSILTTLADKYAVRAYVKEKIGAEYLNDLYEVYDSAFAVDFDKLPEKFVIKGVHGCGFNLIVTQKSELNIFKARLKMAWWLSRNQYYRGGKEWAYKNIKPRLIVERYLEEFENSSITDYKFYCFDGKPKFLEVHLDRKENHLSSYYDLNFQKLPFYDRPEHKWIKKEIAPPSSFSQMKILAEKLADKLPFVRVDFYSIKGKVIFGEMTFCPGDGRVDFKPDHYNSLIGDYFVLPKIPEGKKFIDSY